MRRFDAFQEVRRALDGNPSLTDDGDNALTIALQLKGCRVGVVVGVRDRNPLSGALIRFGDEVLDVVDPDAPHSPVILTLLTCRNCLILAPCFSFLTLFRLV